MVDSILELLSRPDHAGYSLEFYPPRTKKGDENLQARVADFIQSDFPPTFLDLTWGAGGSTSEKTLGLSEEWTKTHNIPVNMHITCTNMDKDKLISALNQAKQANIKNIVALRGDPPIGEQDWTTSESSEFTCALDLVKFIRQKHGDHFCLSVSGYPEGHPGKIKGPYLHTGGSTFSETEQIRASNNLHVCLDTDYAQELDYLQAKCQAGGQVIISQMFFDPQVFIQFVADCRAKGITCPILPGIMLIQNSRGFNKMIDLCKTKVPSWIKLTIDELSKSESTDPRLLIDFGILVAKWMVSELYRQGGVKHFHLYTLNNDQVAKPVIEEIKRLLNN